MFTPQFWLAAAIVALLSYLLGSVNTSLVLSRFVVGDDIRRHGSGNAGMTNVLRTYGKKYAVITAAGDFLKVVVASILSRLVFAAWDITFIDAGYVSGLFVLLGHLFPLYFHFKGGKGVMVSLAIIFMTNPLAFLIIGVVFIPIVFITKIVSLSSVLGAVAYPILTWTILYLRGRNPLYDTICACVVSIIILITHRSNIKRLLNGTENKFGQSKK